MHNYAKQILAGWLRKYYLRVDLEVKLCANGCIYFVPDILCYSEDGMKDVYEVVHKSSVSQHKKNMIEMWQYLHNIELRIYEVEAYWVMKQIKEPEEIIKNRIL